MCVGGDRRPHPGCLCVITRHRRPSFLCSSQRDERQERQGHVIAPLTERGGEEVRDTKNKGTKEGECWWGFNIPPLSLVYTVPTA